MGGAAKHMSHVWEVYDAKFSDVFNLLTDLTTGQIPVTEKFDGANIHFRVANDGTVRFARNLTDIRNGGFSFADALTLYQNHPARDIFVEGCRAIDEAYTGKWWPFGYSGRDWINTEIIFTEQPQLLEYGYNSIVLHEVVTFLPDGSKTLDPVKRNNMHRLLEQDHVSTITSRDWRLLGPTLVEMPNQSGDGYLTEAIERLKLCMSAASLREDNTLRDFLRYSVRHGLVEPERGIKVQRVHVAVALVDAIGLWRGHKDQTRFHRGTNCVGHFWLELKKIAHVKSRRFLRISDFRKKVVKIFPK